MTGEAAKVMEEREISVLIAVGKNESGNRVPVGMVHFHELLKNSP
jgi:hypothetical protein